MEKEYRQQLILDKHGKRNTLTALARNKNLISIGVTRDQRRGLLFLSIRLVQLQISAPRQDSPH